MRDREALSLFVPKDRCGTRKLTVIVYEDLSPEQHGSSRVSAGNTLLAHTSERRYNERAPLILIQIVIHTGSMPVAVCRNFGQISNLSNLTLDFIGAVGRPANGVAA